MSKNNFKYLWVVLIGIAVSLFVGFGFGGHFLRRELREFRSKTNRFAVVHWEAALLGDEGRCP